MRALRSSLPVLGIIALVVLDIGLVYLAYEHTRSEARADDSSTLPTLSGTTTNTTSSTTADPGDATDTADPPTSTGDNGDDGDDGDTGDTGDTGAPEGSPFSTGGVLLDVASDGTVVRATRGDCESDDERPTVQVSSDSGARFVGAGITGLADVLRVAASGADSMLVVGADADCALVAYTSSDGGASWDRQHQGGAYWHLSLGVAEAVHAPGGDVDPGCEVKALLPLSEGNARVLCSTGELRGTDDAGRHWVSLGALEGAVGAYYVDTSDAWAVASSDACDAAVFRTADGGAQWNQRACIDGDPPQAVSASSGVVTVQAGGDIQTSDDRGESWSSP